MKIILLSVHPLYKNFGSRKRILTILNALKDNYGENNIDWINIIPITFSSLLKKNNVHFNEVSKIKTKMFLYVQIKYLNFFYKNIYKIYIFFNLLFKYGRGKNIIFWCEMVSSYWPYKWYKKIFKIPLITDIHGTMDEIIQFSNHTNKVLFIYLKNLFNEIKLLNDSDGVIFVSRAMQEYYQMRLGKLPNIKSIIPSSIDMNNEINISFDQRLEKRKELQMDENFIFVYSGGTQPWQCIDEILMLYDSIRNNSNFKELKPVLMLLIWDKNFNLNSILSELKIKKDGIFLYFLSKEEVNDYLSIADMGILYRKNISTNIVSSPTKANEYLFAGLPIMCTPYIGDISDIIEKNNVGIIIKETIEKSDICLLFEICSSIKRNRLEYFHNSINTAKQYFGKEQYNKISIIINDLLVQKNWRC